ncbi:BOLA class I histocompatibility antigen, alpha chain BL3-6-like isoform X2 [Gadus macrocephalus]|uniref:BOLA class I histocompatibility antigen, alpha chain BL3-6-like isoform X2 n=1 Tax=Gadus macrocephalus TaxID=80720 RepID=UPI0028CB7101|nr:BOLA class I histocompatibility antigen, alpha chain BL3-6-like isoform X2 [Gadus macrocephalus]
MSSFSTLVLLCGVWTVNAEVHSLTYIYTAFTRPVGLPGIHEFSAIGLLDGRPIDYFDSDTQVKVPREDWMKERLDKEYWDKGTSSRQTKQQWFKVNLKILTDRLRKNDTDNHVLQWRHGCEVNTEGPKRKLSGIDQYSYDGDDFLSFDSVNKQWVAPMFEALPTKQKWDGIQQLNDYTDGYLHNECVQWLDTFLKYRKEAIIKASPPKVYMSACPFKNNLKLSCLATGFHPKEITMNIRRDGHLVDRLDGLQSTGIRPNGDGTHQIKMWVLIPGGDTAKYTCEVNHPASNIHVVKEWDHHVEAVATSVGPIVGAAVGLLVVVGLIITGVVIILKRRKPAEKVVPIQPVQMEHQTLLTVETVRELPGNNGEEKEPLKGPGSEASSGIGSGIGSGSGSGSIDGSSSGSIDGSSSGVSDGSHSSQEMLPV